MVQRISPRSRAGKSRHMLEDSVHDPYKSTRKSAGYLSCPECKAVSHEGRWRWPWQLNEEEALAAREVTEELCPACRRIRDHYPGGQLTLSGPFFEKHRDEILNLIINIEEQEKQQHPLQRIVSRTRQDGKLLIAFTDPHLARAAGEAVQHAWKGEFTLEYSEGQNYLRASWHR